MTAPTLSARESQMVKFKGDCHKLPDRKLVEELVWVANAEGG